MMSYVETPVHQIFSFLLPQSHSFRSERGWDIKCWSERANVKNRLVSDEKNKEGNSNWICPICFSPIPGDTCSTEYRKPRRDQKIDIHGSNSESSKPGFPKEQFSKKMFFEEVLLGKRNV